MYKTFMILCACATSGLSIALDEDKYRQISPVFDLGLYESALDPELCDHQLNNISPYELYDASFRVPQGIFGGNTVSMGNYHQCLGIKQDVEGGAMEGKYCMIVANLGDWMRFPLLGGKVWLEDIEWMELNLNFTNQKLKDQTSKLTIGSEFGLQRKRNEGIWPLGGVEFSLAVCIPKACSLDRALSSAVGSDVEFWEEFCRLPGDKPLVAADYTAIVIFSVIGVLAILSTAYDLRHRLWLKKDPVEANELLQCCSVYSNTKSLLTFSSSPGAINCIDGIRSLAITWIISGHTMFDNWNKYTVNPIQFEEWVYQRHNIWTNGTLLSVDTFFALSGLLLVYTSAKKMNQMQLLKNLHVFYLNRLLRILPLLACAVLLQASVFHHVSDGVNWHKMGYFVEMCREYWWTALLHIQNITNPLDYCLPHTWYLSVDMQFHILSPLILFWVLGSRRAAWSGLALGSTIAITASIVYVFLKDLDTGHNYSQYFYKNPLTRSTPFLIGMLTGYILHIYRVKKVKVSFWMIGLGYIVSLAVAMGCLFSIYEESEKSQLELNLNRSLMKGLWSLSVCWLIFACDQGYGGPINWFLSLTIWKFTSRISYAMYLFHYSIIWAVVSSIVTPMYFTIGNIFLMFASVMVYTVMTSVAACVLIDGPCSTLQKLLLKALAVSSKSTTSKTTTTTRSKAI